jgi:small-conductance mechanosensitive channel/CRP-like cAMP-binding protein
MGGVVLSDLSLPVLVSLALAALSLLVRLLTPNRLVRRKLRLPLALAVLFPVVALALPFASFEPAVMGSVRSIANLGLALAVITFGVTVLANPLREDRLPTAVPNIVQDALIVGLFMLAGTMLLQEKFLTTSAVGAVVLGFALQDTLGNAFSGLAIQIEKPFHVGQWIRVGEHEGRVEEITWRATKLRTKATNFVIVPNSTIAKEAIVNYSEPVIPTQLDVDVGASYDATPDRVKAALYESLDNAALALREPKPIALLLDFGASAITYRARFWIEDFARDYEACDQVRSNIYYSFKRHGIEIPWPIEIQYSREFAPARAPSLTGEFAALLGSSALFGALDERERLACAALGEERLYTNGETVIREGAPGGSMFLIVSGQADVVIAGGLVRTLGPGDFFGEMSLLTGERRAASVVASQPCRLMEMTCEAFRGFVMAKPEVWKAMEPAVLARRAELLAMREKFAAERIPEEPDHSFLAGVRRFLRLPA